MKAMPAIELGDIRLTAMISDDEALRLMGLLTQMVATPRGEQNHLEKQVGELLANSPALTVWAMLQEHNRTSSPIFSFDGLCAGCSQHLLDDLAGDLERSAVAGSCAVELPTPAEARRLGEELVIQLATTEWCVQAVSSEECADAIRLAGMMHDADKWLCVEPTDARQAVAQVVAVLCPAVDVAVLDESELPRRVSSDQLIRTANELIRAAHESAAEDDGLIAALACGAAVRRRWQKDLAEYTGSFDQFLNQVATRQKLDRAFATELQSAKMAAMKELAYGASHEINNPLANISTRAQALLRDETHPERRHKLAMINSQAFRAHEMIADMMLFAHPPEFAARELDLVDLARQVVDEYRPDALRQGTNIEVFTDLNSGDDSATLSGEKLSENAAGRVLTGDPTQLTVLLRALIRNSLEAIRDGGEIKVGVKRIDASVSTGPESVGLIVADTGPGIPASVREHMFDPFYSGREAGRGLGFGLCKVWRIAEMHGGKVELIENQAPGATIQVTLPRHGMIERQKAS